MNSGNYIHGDELRRIGPPIGPDATGKSLGVWLREKYLFYSGPQWLEEIAAGRVTVNQCIVREPTYKLLLHDRLARVHALSEEPCVNTEFQLLFQEGDIAVVTKPAGLPMHEAGFYRRKTVRWLLPKFLGEDWLAVHRLDRETSGVLVCARGRQMREALAKQIEHGKVAKTYIAVCAGQPKNQVWTESAAILPARSPLERACCPSDGAGQHAETHFRVLAIHQQNTLVEAIPMTGRTHQIRVHLAHAGLPIVGDKMYGINPAVFQEYIKNGNTPEVQGLAGHKRHLLHAHRIVFQNPLNGAAISVESPLPDDMSCLFPQ